MSLDAPDRPSIRYENPAPKVARIWLDRADTRNAQDTKLLYELNDAFDTAAQDDDVKVRTDELVDHGRTPVGRCERTEFPALREEATTNWTVADLNEYRDAPFTRGAILYALRITNYVACRCNPISIAPRRS